MDKRDTNESKNPTENAPTLIQQTPQVENPRTCRYCFRGLEKRACVCSECGRHQNRFVEYFHTIPVAVSIIMVGIALSQVIIAFSQLKEARAERIKAEEARTLAVQAAGQAQTAQQDIRESAKILTKLILFESSLRSRWGDAESYKLERSWSSTTSRKLLESLGVTESGKKDIFRYHEKIQEMDEAQRRNDKLAADRIWNELKQMMKKDIDISRKTHEQQN